MLSEASEMTLSSLEQKHRPAPEWAEGLEVKFVQHWPESTCSGNGVALIGLTLVLQKVECGDGI